MTATADAMARILAARQAVRQRKSAASPPIFGCTVSSLSAAPFLSLNQRTTSRITRIPTATAYAEGMP